MFDVRNYPILLIGDLDNIIKETRQHPGISIKNIALTIKRHFDKDETKSLIKELTK